MRSNSHIPMAPSALVKPQSERVSESITLLKQLRELGVVDTTPSLQVLRNHLNDWIRTGDSWAGKIEFPSYGRIADVLLPRRADRAATLKFISKK
jgi:hypothetical protein